MRRLKRTCLFLFTPFLFLGACVSFPPSGQSVAALSAPVFQCDLPYPVTEALAKKIDSRSKIMQVGDMDSDLVRAWIPKYNYEPNVVMHNLNPGPFIEYTTGLIMYAGMTIFYPPFIPYSWVEVPFSFDLSATRTLQTKIQEETRQFYHYMDQPASPLYDSYSNEYLWTRNHSSPYEQWSRIWKKAYKDKQEWEEDFTSLAETVVLSDYHSSLLRQLIKNPAPNTVITQGEYESTRHFQGRIVKASKEADRYSQYLVNLRQRLIKKVSSRENLVIYRIFSLYYGIPRVGKISYDPDARLFSVTITGENRGTFHFILADRIMNDQARHFNSLIRKSSPRIYLRLSNGTLLMDGGYLVLPNGTQERLLPYHQRSYHRKKIVVTRLPRLSPPSFPDVQGIAPNVRMQLEGEDVEKDTIYFRNAK